MPAKVVKNFNVPTEQTNKSPQNLHPKKASFLDKLAQLRKAQENQALQRVQADKKYFTGKQRAKAIGYSVASKLIELNSPLKKSYINTLYCNSKIEKHDDTATSEYCKNRVCPICSRIRTAKLINSYVPIFKTWENLSFVTLTIPNVPGDELKNSIEKMDRVFKQIVDVLRKQKKPLKGTRKLEVTYNPKKTNYHPHFHLITEGFRDDLIKYWKDYLPEIDLQAQNIKQAREGSEKELFKYFSKVIFEGEFFPAALDTILQAVKGKRVFRSYGFKLSENQKEAEKIEKLQSQELTELRYLHKTDGAYYWQNDFRTWINWNDEMLHPYIPHKKTEKLISKINAAKKGSPGTDMQKKRPV